MNVFVLQHVHELENGDEDVKMIGIYSTRELAEAAIERARVLPGFYDEPQGFSVACYEVDTDYWTEGYTTVLPDGGRTVPSDT